jgi:hypothetical protein
MTTMTNERLTPQQRIAQIQRELHGLWRPADRLLWYVETRLHALELLGGVPPWEAPERSAAIRTTTETPLPSPWQAAIEGEPA